MNFFPETGDVRRRRRVSLKLLSLSSAILACCWTPASAQDIPPMGPTTPIAGGSQAENTDTPIGTVPQPTVAEPGWVVGVSLGELYTDNLTLAASGKPKQTSWITQIQPFFKSAYSSPRFSGLLDYTLNGYLYARQSRYNQLSQTLNAQGSLVVVPQHLFIEGTALYGSEVIDNQAAYSSGTYFLSNNRANAARFTLSPYWTEDLGNVGTMTLRYSYGRVMYDTKGIRAQDGNVLSGIPDVTSNALQFTLVSPKYQTWGWNAGYSEQRIDPDFGRGVDYALAKLGAYLEINNNTRLLVDGGRESNFLPDGTVEKLGASFWDAGFAWSNGRYNLKALVGHRFYGRSYEFSWSRTAALLTAAISYNEQPTDINQQLLGQNPGQVITSPIGIPGLPSLRDQQVYLMKRGTASADYEMPRGRLRLTLYDERRTYFLADNRQEKIANANIDWLFNVGALTTLTPTVGWQRYQFQDGQIRYNRYAQVALVHQWNPKNFGSLRLRHDSSSVNSVLAESGPQGYGVNVIFLQWTHLF
ncbi:MAG: TIGR03016 family PEP-CTERM system-associated outer membrane protein [Rhodanobacter sp.]